MKKKGKKKREPAAADSGPVSKTQVDAGVEGLDEPLRKVLALLKGKTGIDLSQYKLTTIRRRVQRQMMLAKAESLAAYATHLRAHPEAIQELHDDIFIHVTEFFRDPESFRALREQVFPALVKGRAAEEPIRVWVPGCSTGEEAYSIAMALQEYFEEKGAHLKIQVFATDISEGAVQRARKASYSESMVRGVGEKRLKRFFEKTADGYKLRKELRDLCVISRHDVANNPPFAKLDLVSCRNVLIYFGPELQKRVIPVFHYALKPGAFLWLGQSETTGGFASLFSTIDKKHRIYSKTQKSGTPLHLWLPASRFSAQTLEIPRTGAADHRSEPEFQKSADQLLLFKYAPPGVIINSDQDILQFKGRTAPFLEPAPGHPNHSLMKMVHPDLRPTLRVLIQSARKQGLAARKDDLTIESEGVQRRVNVEVAPINSAAPERERRYLIIFEEVEEGKGLKTGKRASPRGRGRTAGASATTSSKDQYVEQLQQELDRQRECQQSLVEQFESTQEELTSANEELQATNEELQSTNEELETAKEELQSANEELTTMNDELQARNTDLSSLNEALRRGEDRFRLMVEAVKDYAIFMLDPDGKIVSWNEGARRLKGYESSEIIGEHFSRFFPREDIARGKPDWELERARIEGRFEDEGWRLRKDGTRFWANVVINRINDQHGSLIGFSKVTQDLTERKRAEDELRASEERFRLMVSAVKDYAIFMLDPKGNIASWNEGARRVNGYEASEIVGSHFSRFYTPEDVARKHPEEELEIALRDGKYEEEGWRVRKGGGRFWTSVVITRVDGSDGRHIGFVKVTRDLTERKKAEEQLRRFNQDLERRVLYRTRELEIALTARDEFLSIASHELKTPLTSLKLQLQMTRRRITPEQGLAPSPKEIADAVDLGVRQANSLSVLIEDLLDVARVQTGRLELSLDDMGLREMVEEVLARFSQQLSNARCAVGLQVDGEVRGRWDRKRLEQVVVNLISNAIKYAPGKPIQIKIGDSGGKARLHVEDSGPGIGKDQQSRIFERFERLNTDRNVGGLGLGLFISRRIVEAHHGTLHVESEPGRGARFVVELPLDPLKGGETVEFG